jgi:hypothetical protein
MNVRLFVFAMMLAFAETFAATGQSLSSETEHNVWPFFVRQAPSAGRAASWTGAGPLLFRSADASGVASGFRPIWVQQHNADGNFRAGYFVYPLFSYKVDETTRRWNVFEFIRWSDRRADVDAPTSIFEPRYDLEIFPFWFSRQSGDPELSYRGLFPIVGTVKNKFGMHRFSWTAFPLYAEIEKRGAVTRYTPWPFIRVTRGSAYGWGIWPLFTRVERPGVAREAYYLWPFGYNVMRYPSPEEPPDTPPKHDVGALPFYARSTGPGLINVSYAWPFFGYTHRTIPTRYDEQRYFWPLLVQGRGDDRYVNRWGPFYTHSIIKGYDKRWFAWPVVRHASWTEEGLLRTNTRVLYFLYSAQRQSSIARPELPSATLTHVWPFVSSWDNGAGRRQWQIFSPLEVFFPGNEKIRLAWTPLFAVARRDQRAPGDVRTSLFWDAITWEQRVQAESSEFHVGPLFSVVERSGEKRVAFGNGLFGFKRGGAAGRWRMFWLDFPSKPATTTARSG